MPKARPLASDCWFHFFPNVFIKQHFGTFKAILHANELDRDFAPKNLMCQNFVKIDPSLWSLSRSHTNSLSSTLRKRALRSLRSLIQLIGFQTLTYATINSVNFWDINIRITFNSAHFVLRKWDHLLPTDLITDGWGEDLSVFFILCEVSIILYPSSFICFNFWAALTSGCSLTIGLFRSQ